MASRDGCRSGHCVTTSQAQASCCPEFLAPAAVFRSIMPTTAATAASDSDLPKVSPVVDTLYRVAERFGVPVVLLLLVLWWARSDIVQPLLDAHFSVVGKIVDGQKEHSEKLESIGRKLDELIRVSSPPGK